MASKLVARNNLTPAEIAANIGGKKIEAGMLGLFFGSGTNVVPNIAGAVVVLMTLTLIVAFFLMYAKDFENWLTLAKTLIPVILGIMAYLFGVNTVKKA